MVDTCTVTGTIIAPDGRALPSVVVYFRRNPQKYYPANSHTVSPNTIRAIADENGNISVNLVPAEYKVTTQKSDFPAFTIVVPDKSSANLADIQDDIAEPYKTQAQQLVNQVTTARDEAVAAQQSAQSLYSDLAAVNQAKIDAQNAASAAKALYGDLDAVNQAVTDAKGYAVSASNSLAAAQEITGGAYGIGTQPMELPRNTELASGAFSPYEPLSLYPIVTTGATTLTPDDSGKIVWSAAHDITLPDSAAPGMQPGWRVWVKNTDGVSSITIDCDGALDTIDGGASLSLAAGESVLIVMIATGQFGSL